MNIEVVDRTTMADSARRAIREAILDGTLKQGSRIREAELANQLGISRVPLREALQRLQQEGLVQRAPYRGTVVTQVSERAATEIASLRFVLERYAVERGRDYLLSPAGRTETAEAIVRLERCARTNDHAGVIDAHLAIHSIFYRAADNEVLLSVWQSWEHSLRVYLVGPHEAYPSLADLGRAHRDLVSAIESGDSNRITEEFRLHFPLHHAGTEW